MVIRKSKVALRLCATFTAAALVVPLVTAGTANAAKTPNTTSFPRSETLYTSGTAYGYPNNFNPLDVGNMYTGTVGFLYETLFLYNPISNRYIPWLATSGGWRGTTYTIHVRNGVKWSDGSALTGADVAFSVGLNTVPGVPYSYLKGDIESVAASGNTVKVKFTSPVHYTAWQRYLWNSPIVPKSVFSKLSRAALVTAANFTTRRSPVGTGPMTLVSTSNQEACYRDNPNWWGIKQLGLSFHFKYDCDVVNSSNNVELSALLTGNLDWSNNFLPGINALMSTGGDSFLKTYYPKSPYMLSANTAWLEMNTTKAPMSNVNFRRAVAAAINPQSIVTGVYTGIVKAANPVGLLPNLSSYVSSSVVKKYGFSYNPVLAKKYLRESGYHGQTITIEVPSGWTDWMAAQDKIASALQAIGIHVDAETPTASDRTSDMEDGTYDMMIDNNATPDSTPWTYFDRVYQWPVPKVDGAQLNVERYRDLATWGLVQKAATIPVSNTGALDKIYARIETNFLKALPEVPLWYNGAWFQGNDTYWKGYPSSTNPADRNTPVMWIGWLGNMTTVLALAQLRAA
jgi:peptide/nickel transport system substrate-binding protein